MANRTRTPPGPGGTVSFGWQKFKLKVIPALAGRALLAILLIATAPLASAPAAAQVALPTLGDGGDMTVGAERRLGERIARELYRDPDYIDDPVLAEYVQTLWQALLAAARARGELSPELDERFAWEVLLGRDRTVNAFALPGGYLGVHLGLVGVVTSRDELASVLAHELSHVTQRHIARLMAQQSRVAPWMWGAMILGALAASKSPQAAQALVVGGQAVALQSQLNFSRDMEREADRIGYGLMAPAGFAPQGFVSMFDKLQQANRLNDNGSWPYLRSHPLTTQRVADLQSRQPPGGGAALAAPTLEHAMVAARARSLSGPGTDVLRQWLAEPQGGGFAALAPARRAAVLYAAALAAHQLREPENARRLVARLQGQVQGEPGALRLAQLLAAEVELAAGQAGAALGHLPSGPGRPELLLRAQAQLQLHRQAQGQTPPQAVRGGAAAGQADPASDRADLADLPGVADTLQTWVATHPRDAAAWQALAGVWQAQGQGLRAVRAEAEAQVARYDYAAAVDRFKAGQDLARQSTSAGDFVEASIIDTRLRAVGSLLREQAAER